MDPEISSFFDEAPTVANAPTTAPVTPAPAPTVTAPEPPKEAKVEPKVESFKLSDDLLAWADAMGVGTEARGYTSNETLRTALNDYARQSVAPHQRQEVKEPKETPKPSTDDLDPDTLVKDGFQPDDAVVKLARVMRSQKKALEEREAAFKALEEKIGRLDMAERNRSASAHLSDVTGRTGISPEKVKATYLLANGLIAAYKAAGTPIDKTAILKDAAERILGAQEKVEPKPEPKAETPRELPPRETNGRFVKPPVSAPTHRNGATNGNPLRETLIDLGVDPGPPAKQGVNLEEFLP